jgi:hypothetical protein
MKSNSCVASSRSRAVGKKSDADLGRIDDCLSQVLDILGFGPSENLRLQFGRLWELVRQTNLIDLKEEPPPDTEDFVWGSTKKRLAHLPNLSQEGRSRGNPYVEYLRPFGHVLTSATPEELPERIRFLERDDIFND